MYKGKNRSKYACEIYITNFSYSKKVGIVFAMYHRMRSKGTSWYGPHRKHKVTNWKYWHNPMNSSPVLTQDSW